MENGPGALNSHCEALLTEMTQVSDPVLRCSIDVTSLRAPTTTEHSQIPVHDLTVRQCSPLSWILTNHERNIL